MARLAAKLPVPQDAKLKDPAQFTLIGKDHTRRLDSLAKSTGTAKFTCDVRLPGLLDAFVVRPPAFAARLRSFDASAAKAVPGVTDVVQIPEGIAVVATSTWAALRGFQAVKADWDTSESEKLSSEALFTQYRALARTKGATVTHSDQTAGALAKAAKTIEAIYEFPFLAHAAMEPMNCVAWLHDGQLETWSGHQGQTMDHAAAAQAAGLPMDKVKLNSLISGGSFGRRANAWSDYVVEAVHVAKAIGGRAPVRVQATRESDMRAGLYRPLYVHALKAGIDGRGTIVGWQHAIVGQSIMAPLAGGAVATDHVDGSSVEGVWPTSYAIPNMSVDLHSPVLPVRPLWWRSVGHTHTAYVMETMIDELATMAGRDPVEYRLQLLKDKPRVAAVLKLAAERAGWGGPIAPGRARGVAVHHSFQTCVARGRGGFAVRERQAARASRRGRRGLRHGDQPRRGARPDGGRCADSRSRPPYIVRSRSSTAGRSRATSTTTRSCVSTRCRRSRCTSCKVMPRRRAWVSRACRRSRLRSRMRSSSSPASACGDCRSLGTRCKRRRKTRRLQLRHCPTQQEPRERQRLRMQRRRRRTRRGLKAWFALAFVAGRAAARREFRVIARRHHGLWTAPFHVTIDNVKKRRAYQMAARADAVEETRTRIMQAAYQLWLEQHYDDVSLERVAQRAHISKQTLIRQFGSKDQLAYATVDWCRPREEAARHVEPGDVPGAVAIVVERYEHMGDANVRMLEIERRVPAIGYLIGQGRESHRQWVERVFRPFLPKRAGAAYERRALAFYAATEVMLWKLLRRDFGLSRKQTEAVLLELVSGLAAQDRGETR